MTAIERSFRVNGYRLAAREWHPGAPNKVIACHGWLDNAASFDVLAPLLPDCHLVALDMPGHGLSDHKPPQAHYNIWDDLLDIVAVGDEMGWAGFRLLGHSRGAIMSMLLASVMPERVQAVVLLDAILPEPVNIEDSAGQLRRFLRQQRAVSGKVAPGYPSIDAAVAARCKAAGMSEAAARPIVLRGLVEVEGRYVWRSDPRLRTASAVKLTAGHQQSFLNALVVPGLLLLAEGGIASHAEVSQLVEGVDTLDCQWLPGGHHFHLEQQAPAIAERIGRFYASHPQ